MVSSGMTTEMERFAFTPVEARFVRIVCNGNSQNYWNSPTEIRIRYSSPTSIENLSRPVYSSSSAAYDLQGRSLNNCKSEAKHGIVIINGKNIAIFLDYVPNIFNFAESTNVLKIATRMIKNRN